MRTAEEPPMSTTNGEKAIRDLASKENYERLQKDLKAVKDDLSKLSEQLSDAVGGLGTAARRQARAGFRQAREQVDSAIDEASRQGSAALDAAQDMATSVEETLEDAITQRPLAAVGLALGLGFLIGVTWRR